MLSALLVVRTANYTTIAHWYLLHCIAESCSPQPQEIAILVSHLYSADAYRVALQSITTKMVETIVFVLLIGRAFYSYRSTYPDHLQSSSNYFFLHLFFLSRYYLGMPAMVVAYI